MGALAKMYGARPSDTIAVRRAEEERPHPGKLDTRAICPRCGSDARADGFMERVETLVEFRRVSGMMAPRKIINCRPAAHCIRCFVRLQASLEELKQ